MRYRASILAMALAGTITLPSRAQERAGWQWPTASPASVGLDSATLAAFDQEIASGRYGAVDGMLVIRQGKIAYERNYRRNYDSIYGADARQAGPLNAHDFGGPYNYFNPWWHPFYRRGDLHSLQSVSKTVASVVIGVAVTRGDFPGIDRPVLSFFDTTQVKNIDDRKRRMTVRHLLTMTAGLDWNENLPYSDTANAATQMEASGDWVTFTLNRRMAEEPGQRFNYSSGASILLAPVFRAATGQDIEEYAAKYLFAPLGIDSWYWKRTPTGPADTEGGLYLRPRDLAKIWYLFTKNGMWDGRQVVSADWVKQSVTPAVSAGPPASGVKYGLKWWLAPWDNNTKLAWAGSGFGGQVPIAFPELDMVVVFTAWNVIGGRPALGRNVIMQRVLGAVKP